MIEEREQTQLRECDARFPGATLNIPGTARGKRIGLLLFEGCSFMTTGLISEVFDLANELGGVALARSEPYSVRLLSVGGGDVACSSSARISTDRLEARDLGKLHTLIIVGDDGAAAAAPHNPFVAWLRAIYPSSEPTDAMRSPSPATPIEASINGTSIEARAWRPTIVRRDTVERVTKSPDDQQRLLHIALLQVRRDLGLDVAIKVAERLMPGSSRTWLQKLSSPTYRSAAEKVRESARWLLANCERSISIADAARVAAMSQRNYLRRFKRELGITPSEFLLQARLELTRRLLTETKLPIDSIARDSGMRNGDNLAKIFRKRLAVSPSEYRLRSARATQ
jgi:transcriptional regulator GlxA family with amidase domain